MLYFDGASTKNEGSAGIVISNNQGEIFKKAVKLAFPYSHNEAEYEALAMGLDLAKEMKILNLKICGDSNLVIRQLNGDFAVKEPSLIKYRDEIQERLKGF
ncbi:Ribonuclease H [Trema orientale]|uniref:Ribonuclease H n=1 Tax=Trema orientale TaxID=63057 RepID=A0A2P5F1F7_TREOI|nr:Ribonuclease H [Trema orientale]